MTDEKFIPSGQRRPRSRVQQMNRWTSLIGGGALAAFGITRLRPAKRRRGTPRSKLAGIAAAAAGGMLVYRGIRQPDRLRRGVQAEASFTIMKPAAELYRFWRNLENLPKFMYHLDTVRVTGDRTSHWVAKGPMGLRISWDAEIVDERENEWIIWRSLPGSDVTHSGSVHFDPAPGDRGTEVTVAIQYLPVAGTLGRVVAALLGREPNFTMREELRRFKQLVEAGEIPTTLGQPSGRRSAAVALLQAAYREARPSVHPVAKIA